MPAILKYHGSFERSTRNQIAAVATYEMTRKLQVKGETVIVCSNV